MNIEKNIYLRSYNTFGIEAKARLFSRIGSDNELKELLSVKKFSGEKILILGGGSNILLTGDFDGLVIKNEIPGIELTGEDEDHFPRPGKNRHQRRDPGV